MDLLSLLLFILPPYFANAVPVLFGGGTKIDFGKLFLDGRRIFGDGKTWRGLFSGILIGTLVGYLESLFIGVPDLLVLAFYTSTGAMVGDLLGSFVKRRLGLERGHPSLLMDQLLFIVMAYLLSSNLLSSLYPDLLKLDAIIFVLMLTYVMHRSMNVLANRFGLKKVPW